jgi:hypothetical protein
MAQFKKHPTANILPIWSPCGKLPSGAAAALPAGLFSNQKYQFGYILEDYFTDS